MSWLQKIQGLLGMEDDLQYELKDYGDGYSEVRPNYFNIPVDQWSDEQIADYNRRITQWPKNNPNNPFFKDYNDLQYVRDGNTNTVINQGDYQKQLRERAIKEGRLKPAPKGLLQR